jgi:hypothetical protein
VTYSAAGGWGLVENKRNTHTRDCALISDEFNVKFPAMIGSVCVPQDNLQVCADNLTEA